jgi:hypothetical protein
MIHSRHSAEFQRQRPLSASRLHRQNKRKAIVATTAARQLATAVWRLSRSETNHIV